MTIGVDLDNTIAETADYEKLIIESILRREVAYSSNPDDYMGFDVDDVEERLIRNNKPDFKDWLERIEISPYAVQCLQRYYKQGCGIYIITGRGVDDNQDERKPTVSWLAKHEVPYDGIIFTHDKGKVCKQLGVDLIFEDYPQYIEGIISGSPNTRVFIREHLYNSQCRRKYRDDFNVRSFKSWHELLNFDCGV